MKFSKWALGCYGLSAAFTGAAYLIACLLDRQSRAELGVLAFVFFAICILCFAFFRSDRVPEFVEKDWPMNLMAALPVLKAVLLGLAIEMEEEKLYPLGLSGLLDFFAILNLVSTWQKRSTEWKAQKAAAAKEPAKPIPEKPAEQPTAVKEAIKPAPEKPAEQPSAVKEAAQPSPEKTEGDSQSVDTGAKESTEPERRSEEPMQECRYEKAGLIAQAFELNKIKFCVIEGKELEVVCAAFQIKNGPSVNACFFVEKTGCVHMRVSNLITDIPAEKHLRMLEACNVLNTKLRFFKFSLNKDNTIGMTFDFLETTPKDALGSLACEAFLRSMNVLNNEYGVFMKALYTNEDF